MILEEIGEANDNPDDLVHEVSCALSGRATLSGRRSSGPPRAFARLLRPIYRYYRDRYTPANLIVSVAGHVREREVAEGVERLFRRRAARRESASRERLAGRPHGYQHVTLTSRRGLEQVHVCFGTEGPSQASGRRFAANLLDIILGGGMSSRLFQEVREKRGLAYTIASSLNAYRLGGYESISAACVGRNLAPSGACVWLSEPRLLSRPRLA